jgi:hypothetical protein
MAAFAGKEPRRIAESRPVRTRTAFFVFEITTTEITVMEIESFASTCKPARNRLPNRRPNETLAFERDGSQYRLTVGYFPDGRAGEIFLNHDRGDSMLDVLTSDAAILASIALQYGAPLDELRHALKRDSRGIAASPIGAAVDLIT